MTEETEERELIEAARLGDAKAFGRLIYPYDGVILKLALRISKSEQEARTLYRNVLIAAYENLSNFRFECKFNSWIYRYATAVSIDYLKKQRPQRPDTFEAALATLTPHERMTLEWKHYLGESLETISEVMGTDKETSAQALIRGIRKLHEVS